jgi:hypothetical protein
MTRTVKERARRRTVPCGSIKCSNPDESRRHRVEPTDAAVNAGREFQWHASCIGLWQAVTRASPEELPEPARRGSWNSHVQSQRPEGVHMRSLILVSILILM